MTIGKKLYVNFGIILTMVVVLFLVNWSAVRREHAAKELADTTNAVRFQMMQNRLYLSNYLDSRFRAAVRIDPKEIADFYQSSVVPRAKARGQEPPTLDTARDSIQEALIQNGINRQAEQWLKESRLRVHIEKSLDEVAR